MRADIKTIIRETLLRHWGLGLALLISACGKIALLALQVFPFHSDEAVVALMARHILQCERPLFFYGQAYMGSLDAVLVAAGFAVFGQAVWVIRAVQVLLFLGTIVIWYRFCELGFESIPTARLAALLLAVSPVLMTLYTTVSIGGYGEALFLGSLSMFLALQIRRGKRHPLRWFGLGLCAGIGLWAFPLSLVLTGPALLAAAPAAMDEKQTALRARIRPLLFFLLPGLFLGVLPMLAGLLDLGATVIQETTGSAIAGTIQGNPLTIAALRLMNFALFGVSALLGMRPSWELRWLAPALLPLALIIDLAAIGFAAWSLRKKDAARDARRMLAGSVLVLALVYLFTPFGNDPSGRYFLPLGLILAALCADFLTRLVARLGRAFRIAAIVLIAFQAAGNLECAARMPPGFTTQFDPVARLDQRDLPRVIDFLRRHGETRGYTNYWISFPLAFLSDEELIFTARLPYHEDLRYTPRDDRYPAYDMMVESSDRAAYITSRNPALDALLVVTFAERGITYRVEQIGDFRIYYELSEVIRPEQISPDWQAPAMNSG